MTPKCPDCKRDQDDCICASPASAPEVLEWLETELSAISCRYHGDPSYDHDAYWMRERVEKLIEEARKVFAAPTPPVIEDRWQPIETAPKDGSEFVTCNTNQGGVKELVSWNIFHGFWQSKGASIHMQATYWMPLPKAPAMQEDKP